jgi:hypothetical protein
MTGRNKTVMAGLVPAIHGSRQPIVKVIPVGVRREDQAHPPAPRPVLHVELALNCDANVPVGFSVYQTLEATLPGKAIGYAVAMLPNATGEITGDAGIKRAVRSVGYNVDPSSFHRTNWRAVGGLWRDFMGARHKAGRDEDGQNITELCSTKS